MIKIYYIDEFGYHEHGNYAWMNSGDEVPDNYVVEPPPTDYQKARYVNGAWIDQAAVPPEEQPEPPKTAEELIAELEARVAALEDLPAIVSALEERISALEPTEEPEPPSV